MNYNRLFDAACEGIFYLLLCLWAIMAVRILIPIVSNEILPPRHIKHFWFPIGFALGKAIVKLFDIKFPEG